MIKKFIAKKAAKKLLKVAAQREVKVAAGAIATIATHKAFQYVSKRVPKMWNTKES